MIFDRNGKLLVRDTSFCQWAGGGVIKTLHPNSVYKAWPGLTLQQILQNIKPFGRPHVSDSLLQNPDFTLVVTWAKFIGGYNYRLFDLAEAVKQNNRARIRLIWLNIDIQKSWNIPKKQQMRIICTTMDDQ